MNFYEKKLELESSVQYLKPNYSYKITGFNEEVMVAVYKHDSINVSSLNREPLKLDETYPLDYFLMWNNIVFADIVKELLLQLEEHDIDEHLFRGNGFHINPHPEVKNYNKEAKKIKDKLTKARLNESR